MRKIILKNKNEELPLVEYQESYLVAEKIDENRYLLIKSRFTRNNIIISGQDFISLTSAIILETDIPEVRPIAI